MDMDRRRAFTIAETLACTAILAALTAITVPVLQDERTESRSTRDRQQLVEIHRAMIVYAHTSATGRLPTPGLVNRLPDPDVGNVPGFGDEDVTQNHTAPVYSLMVATGYFVPDILISPVEPNRVVHAKSDYNYDAYDPSQDVYWDPTFTVFLDDVVRGSNASYAHLELTGDRKTLMWRDHLRADQALLANRGPRDGATEGDDYTRSPTLLIHPPKASWMGNVVFADNHVELAETFIVEGDNWFRDDPDHDRVDTYLGVFLDNDGMKTTAVWDPLIRAE